MTAGHRHDPAGGAPRRPHRAIVASKRRPRATTTRARAAAAIAVLFALIGCENPPGLAPPSGTRTASDARPAPTPLHEPTRAVWVARFHYRTADDIRTIMRNCAELGFNTVLWQVRGDGTVAYRSDIEPFSPQYNFEDPGFDPLRVAVEEAHRHNLRIEAWVNVMPGWRGPKPPPIKEQLYNTHPAWFLLDQRGQRQPLGDFYVILNPCLPVVRQYLTMVFDEIVSRYPVDGLHLDYIRYAWDTTPNARERYPRDPQTLRLYRAETGKHPDDDPDAWDHWRANQLTRLVSKLRDMLDRRRPGLALTAAVWSDPRRGYESYFQNAVGWARTGLVDALYPMAYTEDVATFERYIGTYQQLAPEARIIPGLGVYKHEQPQQFSRQLERCRMWGGDFALFSYDSLHATAGDRGASESARAASNRLRQMRRAVLTETVRASGN